MRNHAVELKPYDFKIGDESLEAHFVNSINNELWCQIPPFGIYIHIFVNFEMAYFSIPRAREIIRDWSHLDIAKDLCPALKECLETLE